MPKNLPSSWLIVLLVSFFPVSPASASLPATLGDGTPLPSLAPMLEEASPAVVNIATITRVQTANPLMNDPFFRRFFHFPDQPQRRGSSAGSGVIVDAERGQILTNHHVISNADRIRVTLQDGRALEAEVIGSDAQVDIALLQVDAEDLVELPLADAGSLRVGDFVVAIGNPFGLGQTVTSGIVSAMGRSGLGIHRYEDFIQTDASINPGNSGGALVNLRGELVGINSAILAPGGGNIGIGFAIPTRIAITVRDQLLEHGEVRRGRLGIIAQELTPDLAEALGVDRPTGVVVAQVEPGSVGEDAGLQAGDVVLTVNEREVRDPESLRNRVGLVLVGERLEMQVMRDGRQKALETVIREPEPASLAGERLHPDLAGVIFRERIEASTGQPGAVEVYQVDRGSRAWREGIREGDRVVAANRRRVVSMDNLRRFAMDHGELLLQMQRGNRSYYLVLR